MGSSSRPPNQALGRKARLARFVGRTEWIEDGRTDVPVGLSVLNFIVQRLFGVNAACDFPVHFTSVVIAPERLTLGRGVVRYLAMSPGLYVQAINGLSIGDDVMLGPGVRLISANHTVGSTDTWSKNDPITIGDRVWIAANAVVLPGISIGDDAVIGAGAVVTRDVPVGATAVGVPATVVTRPTAFQPPVSDGFSS